MPRATAVATHMRAPSEPERPVESSGRARRLPVVRVSRAVIRMLVGGLLLTLVLASPAGAHDPIFVDERTLLADSPIIRDGTISFATYGVITEPEGVAHVRLDLADGDTLHVEVLVPDQPPENDLDDFSHLTVTVTAPDGSVEEIPGGSIIDRYDERFTGTAYLRVAELDAPAITGTYGLAITSTRPTRFTVATGRTEQFGTEVANYERGSLDAITTWYQTAPPEPTPTTTATAPPTTSAAPPPTSVSSTSTTSVPPPSDSNDTGTEVAAAPTAESADGSDSSTTVVVLAAAVALAAAGWWFVRRRSSANEI